MFTRRFLTGAALALTCGAVPGTMLAHPPGGGRPPRGPPPPEAYAACASASEGDACTVTFHEHTIDGICAQRPDEEELHCRPTRPPPRTPPPEAYAACASASEGDACTVTFREHTIEGTCVARPDEAELHCRPDHPPPPPPPPGE